MSASRTGRTRLAPRRAPAQPLESHAHLLNDVSHELILPARSRRGRLDAIIVPAARPASALTGLIDLAARLDITIVVLCSLQANFSQVAQRVRAAGARGIAVDVEDAYTLPEQPTSRTSSNSFFIANGERVSDLSVKRNIGLWLARSLGWRMIVFVDDDITLSGNDIARLGYQLDNHQIAGMICRSFPDNSVLCHARRLAKLPQDVFVTGAVLGVNCNDLPLPFFPDIYNEDWFFFAEAAARHRLTKVGEARQAAYNPYDEARARHEEFGDLLAEALYSLIDDVREPLRARRPGGFFRQITDLALEHNWSTFIEARRKHLTETRSHLEEFLLRDDCNDDVFAAIKALNAADSLYDRNAITAERCGEFLDAWVDDIQEWNKAYARTGSLSKPSDAMKSLQITNWEQVR